MFDSSALIGGSGEIAVSDTEDELYQSDVPCHRFFRGSQLDEGYKCLQIDLNIHDTGNVPILTSALF